MIASRFTLETGGKRVIVAATFKKKNFNDIRFMIDKINFLCSNFYVDDIDFDR